MSHDGQYDFFDQSDDIPQEIAPKLYSSWSVFPWLRNLRPHPVLCGQRGILRTLPDHMHEGEIVVPASLAGTRTIGTYTTAEWPGAIAPDVIATATVVPHTNVDAGPVNGTTFGVIGAYDGASVSTVGGRPGRIVVDATWHHWFNINLVGDHDPGVPVPAETQGFLATPAGKAALFDIQNYHLNVAIWLAPPAAQAAMLAAAAWNLLWLQPINELPANIPLPLLGASGVDALGRQASQCIVRDWIFQALPEAVREVVAHVPEPDPGPLDRVAAQHVQFAVGGALQELRRSFPAGAAAPAGAPEEKELSLRIKQGIVAGMGALVQQELSIAERASKALKDVAPRLAKLAESK